MSRKNLLKGLLDGDPGTSLPPPALDPARPRRTKGAIGVVSRSIADLAARSVLEIDPSLIDSGGLADRIETDPSEDAALARSIAEHGQQVPVLVRPNPEVEGRYQIVYGRRRVMALKNLGLPIRALVRHLDDKALVLAQGQENSARRDLSFIEKASFARAMAEAGYGRATICDALSTDKTMVSRLLAVAEQVPPQLVQAIGAAPSVGRDRWLALASRLEAGRHSLAELCTAASLNARSEGSDDRFAAVFDALGHPNTKLKAADREAAEPIQGADSAPLGAVRRSRGRLTLTFDETRSEGFERWLLDRLPELHRAWQRERAG